MVNDLRVKYNIILWMEDCETAPIKKRSRSDRSLKFEERKLFNETVVKSALRKYIKNIKQDEIIKAIKTRVYNVSNRLNMASVALSGLLKELYDGKENVQDVLVPEKIYFF
jgi:hypothetical protein